MNDTLFPAIIVEPPTEATACVIWLHGLGADGHDFASIVPQLRLPPEHAIRFIFPHAPQRPVTINGGCIMPAWYDILQLDPLLENEADIRHSAQVLGNGIAREIACGIPARRLVLAGFSQGGAIALYTALRYPDILAGVLALSTYLPLAKTLEYEALKANRQTPIWMAHGQDDEVVPIQYARRSVKRLEQLNYTVDWHTYPMAHTVCATEANDIGRWLRQLLHFVGIRTDGCLPESIRGI